MKNFKKIALGLLVGAMGIGFSAFTNASNRQTTTYTHTTGTQNWNATLDQNASDYSAVASGSTCNPDPATICNYSLVSGVFVQKTQGTYIP